MKRRILTIITVVLVLTIIGVVYYRYYFVFGEGTKAGTMNYFVKKGYVFKTYEGRLIQSGINSKVQGAIASNEFNFSVTDTAVANKLFRNSGAMIELHYKEYIHTLPWRGMNNYVVDSVMSVSAAAPSVLP